jgi:hypothetical protein
MAGLGAARLGKARRGAARQGRGITNSFQQSPEGKRVTTFRMKLQGTSDLLMRSSRLANPLDPATKALKPFTGKQRKTDDDHETIARLEHFAGLYMDPDVGPYIPSDNIWRSLYDAGKKHRLAPKVKEGIFFPTEVNPLEYKGPRDADGLWKDENFRLISSVVLQRKRVMRCRPLFRKWSTEATGILDDDVMNFDDLATVARTAGEIVGLGDWRPRFGRYICTLEKVAA